MMSKRCKYYQGMCCGHSDLGNRIRVCVAATARSMFATFTLCVFLSSHFVGLSLALAATSDECGGQMWVLMVFLADFDWHVSTLLREPHQLMSRRATCVQQGVVRFGKLVVARSRHLAH